MINIAQIIPDANTIKSPTIVPFSKDWKSTLVVTNIIPKRLKTTPEICFLPICSFLRNGLNKATQTTVRLTKSDDLDAEVKDMPIYCKRYAIPFIQPKNRTKRLLKSNTSFFENRPINNKINAAKKNLKNTKV